MYGFLASGIGFAAASWQWQPSPHDPATVIEIADVTVGSVTAGATLTEGADLLSGTSSIAILAVLSAAESSDTLAATATVASAGIAASLNSTEGADVLASVSAVAIGAVLAVTEAADAVSTTAALPITASAILPQGADTAAGQAVLPVQAAGSATEAPDTVFTSAALAVQANFFQGELPDSLVATGNVGAMPISAALDATEAPDALDAAATLQVSGNSASGGDIGRLGRKRPVIHYVPAKKLEEALDIIEDVRPTGRVSSNKKKVKRALEVVRDIAVPPDYSRQIGDIETALSRVARETARHQGMVEALMRVAMHMQNLIADMQLRRERQKQRNLEKLLWLI
jgi:hypothetical protein